MTKKQIGVIIIHGCEQKLFLSKKTLEDMCTVICPRCKQMISLSLFDSTVGERLLKICREISEEEIKKL